MIYPEHFSRILKATENKVRIRVRENKGPDTFIASGPTLSGIATFHKEVMSRFKPPEIMNEAR